MGAGKEKNTIFWNKLYFSNFKRYENAISMESDLSEVFNLLKVDFKNEENI